jgi:hypothetical protein
MLLIILIVPPLAIASAVLIGVLGYLIEKNAESEEHK